MLHLIWAPGKTNCLPTRLADGNIKVNDGNGLTSAGIFTAQGRLVGYLFHNLPLVERQLQFLGTPARF